MGVGLLDYSFLCMVGTQFNPLFPILIHSFLSSSELRFWFCWVRKDSLYSELLPNFPERLDLRCRGPAASPIPVPLSFKLQAGFLSKVEPFSGNTSPYQVAERTLLPLQERPSVPVEPVNPCCAWSLLPPSLFAISPLLGLSFRDWWISR